MVMTEEKTTSTCIASCLTCFSDTGIKRCEV